MVRSMKMPLSFICIMLIVTTTMKIKIIQSFTSSTTSSFGITKSNSLLSSRNNLCVSEGVNPVKNKNNYKHTLAILTLPLTTPDRIANEAILEQGIEYTHRNGKLSVILRCRDDDAPSGHSLPSLRRYMSELYSAAYQVLGKD